MIQHGVHLSEFIGVSRICDDLPLRAAVKEIFSALVCPLGEYSLHGNIPSETHPPADRPPYVLWKRRSPGAWMKVPASWVSPLPRRLNRQVAGEPWGQLCDEKLPLTRVNQSEIPYVWVCRRPS